MSRYGKFDNFCRDTGNSWSTLPGTMNRKSHQFLQHSLIFDSMLCTSLCCSKVVREHVANRHASYSCLTEPRPASAKDGPRDAHWKVLASVVTAD
jgi:hypothetical protein